MKRLLLLSVSLSLSVACSSQNELREKALTLCRYDQMTVLNPDRVSASLVLKDLVTADDLRAVETARRPLSGLSAGATVDFHARTAPLFRALNEAEASVIRCEVTKVEQSGSEATVSVRQTSPDLSTIGPASDLVAVLDELSRIDTPAAQVAKAKEWIGKATATTAHEETITFLKTSAGWRAHVLRPPTP